MTSAQHKTQLLALSLAGNQPDLDDLARQLELAARALETGDQAIVPTYHLIRQAYQRNSIHRLPGKLITRLYWRLRYLQFRFSDHRQILNESCNMLHYAHANSNNFVRGSLMLGRPVIIYSTFISVLNLILELLYPSFSWNLAALTLIIGGSTLYIRSLKSKQRLEDELGIRTTITPPPDHLPQDPDTQSLYIRSAMLFAAFLHYSQAYKIDQALYMLIYSELGVSAINWLGKQAS